MNTDSKIEQLKEKRKQLETLVQRTEETRNELHSEESRNKYGEIERKTQEKVNSVKTYSTITDAIDNQDFELRAEYINAVSKDIESRKKVRGKLLNFYIWFTVIVTICIFIIVIDPITLYRGKNSFYPVSLKLTLCGAFFANLISIIMLMIRYSFAPIDNIMEEFKDLGNGSKK